MQKTSGRQLRQMLCIKLLRICSSIPRGTPGSFAATLVRGSGLLPHPADFTLGALRYADAVTIVGTRSKAAASEPNVPDHCEFPSWEHCLIGYFYTS